MEAARNLPRPDKDDGLAKLLALWEDHLLQHTHLVQRGWALLQPEFHTHAASSCSMQLTGRLNRHDMDQPCMLSGM